MLKESNVLDEHDHDLLQVKQNYEWQMPPPKHHVEPEDRMATFAENVLERFDGIVYAIVGICFLFGAFCALGYSFWQFGVQVSTALSLSRLPLIATSIIDLISDLLLVLIIMEVLGTVIHYLKSHATSLRPFLFIGIVSATRGILSIGAKLSVQQVEGSNFTNSMIELGVNAAVILTLGITLKLLGKLIEDNSVKN